VIDGSRFSKHIGFILYGLKLNNYAAKCPWTKKPIFTADGTGKNLSMLQSKNCQINLKIVLIGKEDAAIYSELKDLMEEVTVFKGFKIGQDIGQRSADVSIDTVCTDLSATWKGTGKGGACKVCSYFCSCCVQPIPTTYIRPTQNTVNVSARCSIGINQNGPVIIRNS
jgi:hypothetical protein